MIRVHVLYMCGMRISFPKVLKSERPDVNEKRSDLLKLQGTTVILLLLLLLF